MTQKMAQVNLTLSDPLLSRSSSTQFLARILVVLSLLLFATQAPAQSGKDSLIAFVGEIIDVKYSPEENEDVPVDTIIRNGKKTVRKQVRISFDNRYIAKYKVLQLVYGSYEEDTITFFVYDHYGQPAFSVYKNVLLFVSRINGQYYHEKYQYFDVYQTTDGRWASPGDPYKFDEHHRKKVKPDVVRFREEVSYDISRYDKRRVKEVFPPEYYTIIRKKAFPKVGTYVEDLFTVKKEGVLTSRGVF